MEIFYNGKDISSHVETKECIYESRCDNTLSHLRISFEDNQQFDLYGMRNGDEIRVKDGSVDSKKMYINKVNPRGSVYEITANPIKQSVVAIRDKKIWKNVKFEKVLCDLAQKMNLSFEFYGIPNVIYANVEQDNERIVEFAARLARLEGCILTFFDGKLIVASCRYLAEQAVRNNFEIDNGDVSLTNKPLYSKCQVFDDGKEGSYSIQIEGGTLTCRMKLSSIKEGNRFAKNLLEYHNSSAKIGCITADDLLDQYSSGSYVTVVSKDYPRANGNALIYRMRHDLVHGYSKVWLRYQEA